MTENNIPIIIAAAVAAAGPRGSNDAAWKAKINEAIPHIASMIGDGSRQTKIANEVLNASVFVAQYVRHEVEASSTRCVVWMDSGRPSRNYPDGIEPIRSHRTDNAQGKAMKERLDQLEPGDEIVVWKALEEAGENKVRVLVHFETRPKHKVSVSDSPSWSDTGRSPSEGLLLSDSDGGRESDVAPVLTRFEALPTKTKVAVAKRARAVGINVAEPDDDTADKLSKIIDEEESK
jgi:hypothetical protein